MAIVEAFTPLHFHFTGAIDGRDGGTSAAQDTTGATTLILSLSYFSALSPAIVVSDSKSNTWIPLTARENVSGHQFYYCIGATVGTGHTFTVVTSNGADFYPAVVLHGFTGITTFEAEAGSTTGGVASTSLQPGSLTPTVNGALVITGLAVNVVSNVSVDSGLTLTEHGDVANFCVTAATGWKVQSTAAAINPTWSWTNSVEGGTNLAIFTAAGADIDASLSEAIKVADSVTAALISLGYSNYVSVSP